MLLDDTSRIRAEKCEQKFSIEKSFSKSENSGFDMEKCKIKEYDRFNRLFSHRYHIGSHGSRQAVFICCDQPHEQVCVCQTL